MHSAQIGATPEGGLCRLALSDADAAIRAWLTAQITALGGTLTLDPMGSLFARFEGTQPTLAPIAIGSHLDTQPTGGKFDGVLGVLGGLEVIRTLHAAGQTTRHPLMLIDWTNEEGARFAPAMVASGVFAGAFEQQTALTAKDTGGITIADELARHGWPLAPQSPALGAYFELHIEQGPLLEQRNLQIGVVTGVQGIVWLDITVHGASRHAGTTPMPSRQDPVQAAARMALAVDEIGRVHPDARSTIGTLQTSQGARNTVADQVHFSVDLRHPNPAQLAAMEQELRAALPSLAAAARCTVHVESVWQSAPVSFHPACIQAVSHAAAALGLSHGEIVSGAGHDAVYVARVAPTAMIFVPCLGGISHHPAESITPAQAADGANVLLHAVLAYDADPA
jgi:N-carbamoyl-L-amino-acid hydrolase